MSAALLINVNELFLVAFKTSVKTLLKIVTNMLKALDIYILLFSTIYNVLLAKRPGKRSVNMAQVSNAKIELELGWPTVFMK